MIHRLKSFGAGLAVLLALLLPVASQADEGWVTLFDGKGTAGWVQRGGKAAYAVEDGALVGRTVLGERNSFLCPPKEYADFVLEFEVWVDPKVNSGVQFRSASRPDYRDGVVHGYQVEIDPSERAWSGGIYDEQRRGWIRVTIEISDMKHLEKVMKSLRGIPGVLSVDRARAVPLDLSQAAQGPATGSR